MNYYPELEKKEYRRTSVEMGAVIAYLRSLNIPKALKIAAYVMFRQESGNGRSGVNNNYLGIQADSGRWPASLDKYISGYTSKAENMTGKERLFLTFEDFKGSIQFLLDRIESRGLYVGGTAKIVPALQNTMKINSSDDWVSVYWTSWVTGNPKASAPADERRGLLSMYAQGNNLF